ncbi:MAG: peptidoglycan DD-metalloendopeptidase family protein [Bacteroidales bacterium]|nr:peptidoglycan DD-metalloendopeptidase family protein [Bacteroidales bacterium]
MHKILITIFIFLTGISFAQNQTELEKKKQQTQKDINYTNKLLQETQQNKKNTYNQLLLIDKKISLRQELLNNIIAEQNQLKIEIKDNNDVIESLEADLVKIKSEYAEMLRFAYKHRNKNDIILFVFSAESFNQAYKRMKYVQQYSEYRKKQVKVIKATQEVLNARIAKLETQKQDLDALMAEYTQESVALQVEKQNQNEIIVSLKSEEQQLKDKLRKYQEEKIKIQNAITELIRKEAELAKAKNKASTFDALTPEQKLISTQFGENKGRLPWPVQKGIITYQYGIQAHPVLKDVKEQKNGIGISTLQGAMARAVFEGTVTNILPLSSNNYAVMVKHGEYITVYVNIREVIVSVGQSVKTKQEIGTIYTNPDDKRTTLELQIWKGTTIQNPIYWIAKQ